MRRPSGRCLVAGAALVAAACTPFRPQSDQLPINQLAVRAIQTRSYSGQDARSVVKTLVAVLQDDGFLVHYGDLDLGLLDASRSEEAAEAGLLFGLTFFDRVRGAVAGDRLFIATTDATANVSTLGDRVAVRVNFQRRITDEYGEILRVAPVTDPKRYQEFFAKLDKGLFLAREGL